MSYKTILAVLQSKADAGRVLDCALPLATRFSAHLIGVHAEAIPIPYVTPMGFPDTDFIAASAEMNQQRSAEIKALFDARAAREGVSYEWQAMENVSGDSAVSALVAARASDLIVVQQSDADGKSGSLANVETLLFESGRPVLFVPYAVSVQTSFRRVMVAWNGTQQAARATFDALPFIREAEQTEILSLDATDSYEQDGAVAGVDIAAALARHGAKVTFASEVTGDLGAGEAIENRIAETEADLLVMGAYSQSWLKEFFFGGATRTLLRSMPVATLMSR
ncbi:universal stress protein [Mesorhizobium microcysteis]|uniref:Universal stress protein n=1 Tax=Neoaquamicrobium microcysteis TaxID=2682781 RepID=A0A5D4GSC3_9HYPH|nr:universal stress protein [Mesorhizobium microcysteis]TYR30962.1 universal stress protein [Mesorhizobium microcysteis]